MNTQIQQPTDTQLKQALAKMLPEHIAWYQAKFSELKSFIAWTDSGLEVLDTELLHLCWLTEEGLTHEKILSYSERLEWILIYHATWQQRVIALAKVKGIVIV